MSQGRVPSSEVVDGDFDPQRAHGVELCCRGHEIGEQDGLGDLDRETVSVDAGVVERGADVARQMPAQQVPAGDVDGNGELRQLGDRRPGGQLTSGLAQDPAVDIDDERGGLGDGDERVGREHSVVWSVPANERLGADEFS